MSYTYKREIFLNYKEFRARVILGGMVSAMGLRALIEFNMVGLFLFIPGAFLLLWGLKSGLKDYNDWQNFRNDHMKKGICCTGKVVDWGGHIYWKQIQHQRRSNYSNGRSVSYASRESDWWIEVEYIDLRDGMNKRFKAKNMNKKGKYLIGKRADVYLYQNNVYINVP